MSTLEQAAREALERLWPAIEKGMSGLVFTADRAGEVAADMNALRAALAPVVTESVTAAEPVADITPGRVKFLADIMADCRAARDIPTGGLYRSITYDQWHEARARLHLAIDALALYAAPPAPAVPLTPEALAWALAEEAGDDPGHLIWQGNPPEPWGEVWCRYMPQAERLLKLLAAKPTEGEPR